MKILAKAAFIGMAIIATGGATVAIAGDGMGYGKGHCMNRAGMGMHHGKGHRGHGMKHGMHRGRMGMLNRIPDLTDKQRKQLNELFAERDKMRQAHRESMKARLAKILTDEQKAALPIFQH